MTNELTALADRHCVRRIVVRWVDVARAWELNGAGCVARAWELNGAGCVERAWELNGAGCVERAWVRHAVGCARPKAWVRVRRGAALAARGRQVCTFGRGTFGSTGRWADLAALA